MALTAIAVEEKMTGGPSRRSYRLELPSERITVSELIRVYVADQLSKFNVSDRVVGPNFEAPEERLLNPDRHKVAGDKYDCDAQFKKAVAAFRGNQFFVIVDGRQVEVLDEELVLNPDTKVSFLKLVPLVGG